MSTTKLDDVCTNPIRVDSKHNTTHVFPGEGGRVEGGGGVNDLSKMSNINLKPQVGFKFHFTSC